MHSIAGIKHFVFRYDPDSVSNGEIDINNKRGKAVIWLTNVHNLGLRYTCRWHLCISSNQIQQWLLNPSKLSWYTIFQVSKNTFAFFSSWHVKYYVLFIRRHAYTFAYTIPVVTLQVVQNVRFVCDKKVTTYKFLIKYEKTTLTIC